MYIVKKIKKSAWLNKVFVMKNVIQQAECVMNVEIMILPNSYSACVTGICFPIENYNST